ncbi:M15 family metallopeptidase [Cohnella yongneupensis]|uniref:D-alanyl-D-alanine carboxypeptidase family protein n=1 Tax=Cohnella yongneupensis TaxID=425006 RepID=A0ABW0QVZ8_9BACL
MSVNKIIVSLFVVLLIAIVSIYTSNRSDVKSLSAPPALPQQTADASPTTPAATPSEMPASPVASAAASASELTEQAEQAASPVASESTKDEHRDKMPACPLYVSKDPKTKLAESYVPPDLKQVASPKAYDIKKKLAENLKPDDEESLYNETLLTKQAGEALDTLIAAADKEKIELVAYSGYRSYNTQRLVYERYVNSIGQEEADKISAVPGHSEHQTGLAMDITSKKLVDIYSKDKTKSPLQQSFGEDPEGKWLAENAHKFGFIMSYPEDKEDKTGYSYEPWHYRYVGVDVASIIYSSNETLGEYVSESCGATE